MSDQEPELTSSEGEQTKENLSLSKSLDYCINLDLEKVVNIYSQSNATWDESSRKTFSDFLHTFLIYTLMNRGEDERKVFTLKTLPERELITEYMTVHSKPTERIKLDDPNKYTNADFLQEVANENFSDDLQKFAYSETIKAFYKYSNAAEQPVTSAILNLSFDYELVKEFILKYFDFHEDVFAVEANLPGICAGLTSLLEYISAEIIELSSPFQEENILTIESLRKGLQSDPALLSLPCTDIFFN